MNEQETKFSKKNILIDLINREMDQIVLEQKRPGWTSWALLGALSTLVWLLINQTPLKYVNWHNVSFIFFSLNLIIEGVCNISSMLAPQYRNIPGEPRFYLSSLYSQARSSLIIRLVQCSLLFYISIHLKVDVFVSAKILVWILLGFFILGYIFVLVLSYCRIPQPKFPKQRMQNTGSIILISLISITMIGYCAALIRNFNAFDPHDLKIAVILALIVYVFILLADLPKTSPILSSLISIRRDLALDKIDINLATRQIDIALSGMQVEDLLQDIVKEILDYYDTINNELKQIAHTFEAIEELISKEPSNLTKDELLSNREAIRALAMVNKNHDTFLDSLIDKLEISMKKYNKKANQIISIDKRAAKGIEELSKKIEIAQTESKKLYAAEKEQISSLKVKINMKWSDINSA